MGANLNMMMHRMCCTVQNRSKPLGEYGKNKFQRRQENNHLPPTLERDSTELTPATNHTPTSILWNNRAHVPNITRHQRPRRPEKEEGPGRGGGERREGGGKERRNSWYYLQPPSNPQSLIYTTTNSGKLRPKAPENKHDFFFCR